MEIKQGIVRNYVVTDREKFCDVMARTLCQMQVSYVQIDNEFHFNDKIYRFYNFGEVIELSEQVSFVCLDREKVLSLSPCDLLFTRDKDDLARMLDPLQDEVVPTLEGITFEDKRQKKKTNIKQLRKHDNKMVNQRLRNSFRQQAFKNRRSGFF